MGNTGVNVFFNGYNSSTTQNSSTQILLHGQHGVAFIAPANATDTMLSLTITAQPGAGFTAMNFSLDAAPPNDGQVEFFAFDSSNNLIPVSSGTNTFPFSHTGENPFVVTTDNGSVIQRLLIESVATGSPSVTAPIADLKQVSVNLAAVPEPSSLVLVGAGCLLGLGYAVRRLPFGQPGRIRVESRSGAVV